MTHTESSNQPWWQVDLDATTNISTIELWNRSDNCCTSRLADVVVFVANSDMRGRTLAELEADPSVTAYVLDGQLSRLTNIDAGTAGRFVRVQLRGSGAPLSLAEVVVYD